MDPHQHMQYMMWVKRNQIFKSHFQPINSTTSWEEQAFAEDAAGPLGGFTWPPRSYSCTFCTREFKSAQALGGHMNVHRRDRALLKQSSSSLTTHIETPPPSPNSPPPATTGDSGSSPSPNYSSLSSTSTTILSPQNSTTKKPSSPQGSNITSSSGKFLSLSNQNFARGVLYNNVYKNVVTLDYNKDIVDTNLSVGLNVSYESYDEEASYYNISSSTKRQRLINSSNDLTSFASKNYVFPTEVVTRKAVEDNIDLVLRL